MQTLGKNNFDLIRLLAAIQVVLFHFIEHFDISDLTIVKKLLSPFAGVPIFFFISGMLISAAWERNTEIKVYAKNRFLRVFPALWVCIMVSVVSLFIFYDAGLLFSKFRPLVIWIFGQATFFQMWNPEFLRGYGIGVVNGSLWTIAVELSFYCFIPVIYFLTRSNLRRRRNLLAAIIILSFTLNYLLESGNLIHD